MRLLADQNVEAGVIEQLRSAGHDVVEVAAAMPPDAADERVLSWARDEGRVLVTNDKDFGELAFLRREASAGLILLRLRGLPTAAKAERTLRALSLLGDRVHAAFIVVTEKRIRRRPLRPELAGPE